MRQLDRILRHEEYVPSRLIEVRSQILDAGVWTMPLLVERDSFILMDGHHRFAFACAAGLTHVPCLLTDYLSVRVLSRRAEVEVSAANIRRRAHSGDLYPPKTTRHVIPESLKITCSYPLSRLGMKAAAGPMLPKESRIKPEAVMNMGNGERV